MAEVDTLISNAKTYADEAVTGVIYWIEKLAELDDLAGKLQFVQNTPLWSYQKISDEVFKVLNHIYSEEPDKPTGLGNFGDIGPPPDFEPINPDLLRQRIRDLINIIEQLPNRINEAIALYNAVNAKILYDLTVGGYGIDPADEVALWERGRDRLAEVTQMKVTEIQERHASLGSALPQGSYNRAIGNALDNATIELTNLNKDILIKRADLYRTAREFSIDKAIELAKDQMGLTKLQVEALRDIIGAELDLIKVQVEMHKEELAVYGYAFDRDINIQKILADIYRTDIVSFSARLSALTQAYGVLQQANSDQWQADKLVKSESQDRVQAQIQAFNAESTLKTSALGAIADVFQQKVAGALSSLNTLVQLSDITNRNISG